MFEGHETAFPSSNRYKPIRYCCVKYASEALLILGLTTSELKQATKDMVGLRYVIVGRAWV